MKTQNRFKDSNKYLVMYPYEGKLYVEEILGAQAAVAGYREFKRRYGNFVRLVRVVVDYGEEI